MNRILILIFLLIAFDSKGQAKKKFYNRLGSKTDSINSYYYEVQRYGLDTVTYSYYSVTNSIRHKETKINRKGVNRVLYYYENGMLQAEGNEYGFPLDSVTTFFKNGEKQARLYFPNRLDSGEVLDGVKIFFFRDSLGKYMVKNGNGYCVCQFHAYGIGSLIEEGEVKNNLKDGVWSGKSKTSSYTFQELYEGGKLVGGVTTSNGEDYEYRSFEEMASPIGGLAAFYEALGEKIEYPKRALKRRVQGKIIVQFYIDLDGSIVDAKVLKGIDPELDRKALEAVKSTPNWKPGNQRGRPVKQRYTLPINFEIG